ncbi:MAG: hypothetical protein M1434_12455 [Chloroflexi bacterium]|nr:hypothetical protein [Chloroflexota bacterium]MCL5275535.1 hypothetical protein [Chloroflexota bacterium]
MAIEKFVGFYTSPKFMANKEPNLENGEPSQFHGLKPHQIVYSHGTTDFTFLVYEDGLVALRMPNLEATRHMGENIDLHTLTMWWREYMDYVNCFQLLLESCILKVMNLALLNVFEITRRDIVHITFNADQEMWRSYSGATGVADYAEWFLIGNPQYDQMRTVGRRSVPLAVFDQLASDFKCVLQEQTLVRPLAQITKSLSEYKAGNYDISLILAWFVVESQVTKLWDSYLSSCNTQFDDGSKRLNSQRIDNLTSRDYTISIVSNILELNGVLRTPVFRRIDKIRSIRNKLVHQESTSVCTAEDSQQALTLAIEMVLDNKAIDIRLNYSYSVAS